MNRRKRHNESGEESSWAMAYADVSLNMLVFFVILVAVAPEEQLKEVRPQIELTENENVLEKIAPRIQDILGIDLIDRGEGEGKGSGSEGSGAKGKETKSKSVSISLNEGDYSRGSSIEEGKGNGFRADTTSQFDGTGEVPAGDVGGDKLANKPGVEKSEEGKDGVDLIRKLPKPLIDSVMNGGDQWEADLSGHEHSILINLGKDIYAPGDYHVGKRTKIILARVYKALGPYSDVIKITVVGHADATLVKKRPNRKVKDNRVLSFYRAYEASEYLRKLGIPNESLDALAADANGRDTRSISLKIEKRTGVSKRNKE